MIIAQISRNFNKHLISAITRFTLVFYASFARILVGTLLATRWTVGMLEN